MFLTPLDFFFATLLLNRSQQLTFTSRNNTKNYKNKTKVVINMNPESLIAAETCQKQMHCFLLYE